MTLFRRLRYYLRRNRYDADIAEELSHHLDLAARDAEATGLPPDRARLEARRRVGAPGRISDASRDVWRMARLENLFLDLRYALRGWNRQPVHATAAIVTLALGVGATTAIASVLNAVLLTPLPYREPERLVQLWERNIPRDFKRNVVNPGNYLDWRDRNRSFEGMAIHTWTEATVVRERPFRLGGLGVSLNMLSVLGVQPALGRAFLPEDIEPGRPRVVILTHGTWQQLFGADSSIVGQPVQLVEGPALVVGVFGPRFRPLEGEQFWQPVNVPDSLRGLRRGRFTQVIGRLKDGVSLEQADADMRTIAQSLETEYPRFNTGWTVQLEPLMQKVTGSARDVLIMVAAAIGLVLLIACANVGGLAVARVVGRQGEIGLRAALGATRGRVFRQLVVEGMVVAGLGGILGLVLGTVAVAALRDAGLSQIPRLEEVRLDLRVLGFVALVVTVAGLICGLLPALSVRGLSPGASLAGQAGRTTVSRGGGRIRAGLVVVQVALSLVLLVGTGLLLRSLVRLLRVDPGLEYQSVLTGAISLPGRNYPTDRQAAFFEQLIARLAALPGVEQAGLTTGLPFTPIFRGTGFRDLDAPEPEPGAMPSADIRSVDPGLFAAVRIPILRGRGIERTDVAGGRPVAVVNRFLAEQLWPGGDPLGKRLWVSWGPPPGASVEVVGVVGDVHYWGLQTPPRSTIYFPAAQQPDGYMQLALRVSGDPASLIPQVERELAALDPNLPLLGARPYAKAASAATAERRYPMFLLALLAGLALLLSAVGLYGVLAYFVGERTREIGVRRALGASNGSLIRLVLGRGVRLVGVGLVLGGISAVWATRLLGTLLYQIEAGDPLAIGSAVAVLAGVGLAASAVPALRAAKVDPALTLRGE